MKLQKEKQLTTNSTN